LRFYVAVPGKPRNVKVNQYIRDPSTEMLVEWQVPDSGSDSYILTWQRKGTTDQTSQDTSSLNHIITNLEPGATYQVHVYAVNDAGNGSSETASGTTS